MAKQIKEMFDNQLDYLKIDNGFIDTVKKLRIEFMNRNDEHLAFFSGNLIGVNKISFKTSDREDWYDLLLEAEESDFKRDIRKIRAIDKGWIRVNDPINLSAIYLLHSILNSKLSPKRKHEGMVEVLLLLQYKFISSIVNHFFPYRTDEAIAKATYEALSRKFDIKREGSWQGLLEKRSNDIISENSIHYNTISKMNDDVKVINMITDIQDRLRNVVKKLKSTFDRVREQNLTIKSTSKVLVFDGEKEIISSERAQSAYTRYLKDIISDAPTFIREEWVGVIIDLVHTVNETYFLETLKYCSDNYGPTGDKNIEPLIDETLLHAYRFLSDNEGIMSEGNDISVLLSKLKNVYLASRMSDNQLIKMKELSGKIVDKSVRTRNDAAKASVRTALQLYIVLRAFAKSYYQG